MRTARLPLTLGLGLLGLVLAVGELTVRRGLLWSADQYGSEAVFRYGFERPGLYDVAIWIGRVTEPTYLRVLVVVTTLVLWRLGLTRQALWWLIATLIGGGAGIVLKLLIARDRPDWPDSVVRAAGYTFPSGHAANSALFACGLLVTAWPYLQARGRLLVGATGLLFSLAVGLSRVMLGVHNLSDVLAGWALGCAVVLLLLPLRRHLSAPPPTGRDPQR